ncbi:two-component system regulatory protein YycI [Paramaledivibacter caminithermalis]|jgi:regulatory protein YycI of two-component signal transduction system YycFG|uniref:Two-component signal transduction system YycFG, regulatory protein YycI n=1 Tax=Paramaledivibacter caminithermalis (strain DSM 15212 / CIP 107654 / DViRD3) TaxID=1121301 RepID=A0A1M6NBY2_PARC5|nr:two-component system regulatory protein YycI [Paramaledivibacter caminithermalis]SHJ93167.1 Two-component signal transduction system YycFG, regulatory protein YycI [Paramaledivibacter caminithermalis DSM 15212]
MDWVKAKNILIIALIITNLFLGYYVIKDYKANNYTYTISQEKIDDVKELLEKKNIIIKADIPKEIYELPELTVEYETYDKEEIESKIYEADKRNYREKVKISSNDKLINYTKKIITNTDKEITKEDAEEIVYEFIKKLGFENDEAVFWGIKEKDREYGIEYKQKYENVILNDGYMKFKLKNNEVISFERRWLKTIGTKGMNKRVIPATKALLLAMDELKEKKENEDSEVIVTGIDLVYSLNIIELNTFLDEEWYEGNEKTGFLYWRIRLENDDHIDIEAYE